MKQTAVGQFYDDLADAYEAIWGPRLHHGLWLDGTESITQALSQMEDLILGRALSVPHLDVVDIGCGNGTLSRKLSTSSRRVTGITLSQAQFRKATDAGISDNLHFILGDWLENDFPDQSFDLAVSVECVSHIEDKAAFFHEVYRTLKPGGQLVLTCYLAMRSPLPPTVQRILKHGAISQPGTIADYAFWIKSAGLELIEHVDLSESTAPTWERMLTRATRTLVRRPALTGTIMRHPRKALCIPGMMLACRSGWIGHGLWVARRPG